MKRSGNKKQSTLFQSWGRSLGTSAKPDQNVENSKTVRKPELEVLEIVSDEDDDLIRACEESLIHYKSQQQNVTNPNDFCQPSTSKAYNQIGKSTSKRGLPLSSPEKASKVCSTSAATAGNSLPGFDQEAGETWIYPTNYPLREYQFEIVKKALFTNTMVVLPTGLGKTFIAAVIMYNFYRWYPQGKVIFMAPTRPLVAQQIEACFHIMGIPQKDTAIMTGTVSPENRNESWTNRRVFFLTPQVLTNDLSRGICPAHRIRCLIVDEAHKAQGNYAYCQVVKELSNYAGQFRIVALSATPGSDMNAVEQVLKNLLISEVEIRTDDSPDIQPYTHQRAIDKVVVPLGQELTSIINNFLKVMSVYVDRLTQRQAMSHRNPSSLNKFQVLKSKEAFCQNPPHQFSKSVFGIIQSDFSILISLCHAYELLQLHGTRSFYRFLKGVIDGEKSNPRAGAELQRNVDFENIYNSLSEKFCNVSFSKNSLNTSKLSQLWNKEPEPSDEPFTYGHPKLQKLQEIVVQHFTKCKTEHGSQGYRDTRVMIFSQYRDSVEEIKEMLERCRPLVRVMSFVGQGTGSGASKGLTQKMQMKVVRAFKDGGFNTLVSTCVGEEGLDIGEVDLIVCYDAPKSPIRLVQRMGRTGRKREGRIVVLLAQGKEEQMYNQSQYRKRSIHKAIGSAKRYQGLNQNSPRMVPLGLNPVCHKVYITVEQYKDNAKEKTKKSLAAKKDSRQKHDKAVKTDQILSSEELEHWRDNWRLPQDEVPALCQTRFLSLQKVRPETKSVSENQKSRPSLSLTNWLPWQTNLQKTHLVGHSQRTCMFVDIMQLSQLQGHLAENEDPYGLEMTTNLKLTDILKPGQKDGCANENITSYFKPGVKRKTTKPGGERIPKQKPNSEGISKKDFSSVPEADFIKPVLNKPCPWLDSDDSADFIEDLKNAATKSKVLNDISEVVILDDSTNAALSPPVVNEEKRERNSSSFLFIKSPPSVPDCEFLIAEQLPAHVIKAIANDSTYALSTKGNTLESYPTTEFYENPEELQDELSSSDLNEDQQSPNSIDFDSESDIILSGIDENLLMDCDTKTHKEASDDEPVVLDIVSSPSENSHKFRYNNNNEEKDGLIRVGPLSSVATGPKPPQTESPIHCEPVSEKELFKQPSPVKVPWKVGSHSFGNKSNALQLNQAHNCTSPKTSTPKTFNGKRMNPLLPDGSPISSRKHNQDLRTPKSCTVLSSATSVARNNNKNSLEPYQDLNFSSVLFDDTSSFMQRSVNKTSATSNKPVDKTQELLTVTQMVSLLNKSHREKSKLPLNLETSQLATKTEKPLTQQYNNIPMFDLGFDIALLDQDFNCDIPSQNHSKAELDCPQTSVSSSKSKYISANVKNTDKSIVQSEHLIEGESNSTDNYISNFNFQIDFEAFDQSANKCDIVNESVKSQVESRSVTAFCDIKRTEPEKCHTSLKSSTKFSDSTGPVNSSLKRLQISSDGELIHPPVRKRLAILDDESSSSCFWETPPSTPRKIKTKVKKDISKRKKSKAIGEKAKCQFVEEEADVSGYASSDDEDTSMDCLDESFVNDQESHVENEVGVDMQALYLQSVRSPGPRTKYKLQYGGDDRLNVFSQVPENSLEDYQEDSFCVNSNEVEYLESTGDELEKPEAKVKLKNTNRQKRKRIMTIVTSSEDESLRTPIKAKATPYGYERPSTSGVKATGSSYTQLKTPPKKMLPPLSLFDRSCEKMMTSPSKPSGSVHVEKDGPSFSRLNQIDQPASLSRNLQSLVCPASETLTIFVDTRELSGGQAIISMLRKEHGVRVVVQQLVGDADYQVGSQVGILRMSPKVLSQLQKKQKIIEKIQNLLDFYDRPYLIVEKDKATDTTSTAMFRNRCLDSILFNLLQTDVKVLYSANQGETVQLLLNLHQSEMTKGNKIPVGECNSPFFQFYTSLPFVNAVVALNFSMKFSNLKSFLKSTPSEIEQYGCISRKQALKIHDFINSSFL